MVDYLSHVFCFACERRRGSRKSAKVTSQIVICHFGGSLQGDISLYYEWEAYNWPDLGE